MIVKIKNKKGLLLSGVLHVPAGKGKCPAVMMLHGFTGYKEDAGIVSLSRELTCRNFIVLRFDCSGSWESEGTTAEEYRLTNYLSDMDCVYEYLRHHRRVDIKRIAIWGHSMGAMAAIIWGQKHPELKAICAVSPPKQMGTTDLLAQFLDEWKRTGWFTKVSTSGHGVMRVPWAFMEDAANYNALEYADKVRSPLMVILGLAEDTVPPEHSRELFRMAPEPKELVEIPGMNHFYKKVPEFMKTVNNHTISFVEKYMGKSTL